MNNEAEHHRQNRLLLESRLEKVSPKHLSEFLYKRGVPVFQCLLCGSEDIGIPEVGLTTVGPDGGESITYVSYVKLDAPGPPFSIMDYQYRVICRNCGFTHHIAVWPVLKWVEEGCGNGQ